MIPATFDGLDIADPEDRALYRQRVAVEYSGMKASGVLREARRLGGKCRTVLDAVKIIANDRIERERLKD